jgi:hypothetical protein
VPARLEIFGEGSGLNLPVLAGHQEFDTSEFTGIKIDHRRNGHLRETSAREVRPELRS